MSATMNSLGIDRLDIDERLGLVREILTSIGNGSNAPAPAIDLQEARQHALSTLTEVIAVTSEVFAGPVTVKEDFDPEHPEHRYVVFVVSAEGNATELLAKERLWLERTSQAAADWQDFRLSLRPQ